MSDSWREGLEAGLGASYRIRQELGGGGMSTTFIAEEVALGRSVVLKALSPDLASGLNAERFQREIQVLARLQHAFIVPLLSSGVTQGHPWYTMPLVQGESLRARLQREGPVTPAATARILHDVAEALAYARTHGVVHRDIKPDNILLSGSHALVADFGIAKALSASTTDGSITATGIAIGTPAYMAPEQAAGDTTTDHRADLYSLGVTGYEMLTGRTPFSHRSPAQVLAAHMTEQPEPISKIAPSVPRELAALIEQLLAKLPEDRPAGAEDVVGSLAAMLNGWTAADRPVTTSVRGVWKSPAGWAAAAALVAVAGFGIWKVTSPEKAIAQSAVAVFPFTVQGGSDVAYLGEGMVSLLSANLDGAGELWSVDPKAVIDAARRQTIRSTEDARSLSARLGAAFYVTGEIVQAGNQLRMTARLESVDGRTRTLLANADGALTEPLPVIDALTASLLTGRAAGRQGGVADATTPSLTALKFYLAGQNALVSLDFPGALQAFERAVAHDSTFAKAHLGVAWAGWWLGRHGEADVAAALRHSGRLSARERHLLVAHQHFFRGEVDEAERLYREILSSHPNDLDALYPLGELLVHYSFRHGRAYTTASRDVLDRVLRIQPTHGEALFHRMHLAAHARELATLDTLTSRVLALQHGNTAEIATVRMLRAFLLTDRASVAERDRVVRDLRSADDFSIILSGMWMATIVGNRALARTILGSMLQPSRSERSRAAGHIMLAHLDMAEGKRLGAMAHLDGAQRLDPDAALFYRATFDMLPYRVMSATERAELRRALERWKGQNDLGAVGGLPSFIWVPGSAYNLARSYYLGLLDAQESRAPQAAGRVAELEASRDRQTLARDLAAGIRAEVARERKDSPSALAALERMNYRSPFTEFSGSPVHERSRERFLRADLLAKAGRDEEALAWLETSEVMLSLYEDVYLAPVLLRTAEIHDRRGDRARAAEYYTRFTRLWQDCDAEFRPLLARAHARLKQLEVVTPQ